MLSLLLSLFIFYLICLFLPISIRIKLLTLMTRTIDRQMALVVGERVDERDRATSVLDSLLGEEHVGW